MRVDANIAASGTISAPFGSFDNLTVSGQPVSTGTGGGASLDPAQDQTITGNWDFESGLTKNGVNVVTESDLSQVTTSGFASVVSGTIIRPLGTAHNPIVLFNFEGDLTDSSGNGHDLTVEAGTQNIVRLGPFLSGHAFDGSTLLLAADTADTELTGDMTLQAIVSYSVDALTAGTKSFAGQTGTAGDGDDTQNFLYRMALNSSDILNYFAESAGGANLSYTSPEHFTGRYRQLVHVTLVRESNDVTYYIDGNAVGSSSGLSAPVDGSATRFRIGGEVATNRWTGVIASVKLIGSALTADQVRREHESTLATATIPESFTTISGAFTQSLTVSGVPVDITGGGGGGSALTVKEADGVPSVASVDTIVVTNGTLTDDGGGQVTISTGGGGGSGGLGQVAASGTIWMPEVAPANGTQYDDEFVQGTPASGTESIWTLWDPGDNQLIFENDEAGLRMRNGNATGEWMGIFQDVPPDGATGKWVAWAYVFHAAAGDLGSGYRKVGIGLFQNADGAPTTSDFQFLGLTSSPGQDWAIERGGYTGYTDTTPSPSDYDKATLNGIHLNGVFLRVIKTNDGVADHTWELSYSFDGVGWKSMTSADPGFDVAQVGIICTNGAGTTLYRYGAKFFRIDDRYNGAGIRTATMRGNFLDPTGSGVGGGSSFDPSSNQTITGEWDFNNSLTVSGVPVSTGGGGSASSLQDAYDNDDGTITTTAGKPFHVIGDEYDGNVDFKVTGSGQITESLQVGSGTVFIHGDVIETPSLIVDGTPIFAGPSTTVSGVIARNLSTDHAPVALWNFDQSLVDSSGNGLDLSVINGQESYSNVNGVQGFKFTGDDTLGHAANAALEITGDVTIEILFSSDDLTSERELISYADQTLDTEVTNFLYGVRVRAGGGLRYDAEFGAGSNVTYTIEDGPSLGNLNHITLVRESADVTFYLNGYKIGASSSGLTAPTGGTSAKLNIGLQDGFGDELEGVICGLKIIPSALTPDQVFVECEQTWQLAPITTLTDATVSGIIGNKLGLTHSPVALYLFDDNLADSSGNGLDLSVGAGAERYTNVNGLRSAKFDSTTYFRYTPGSSALEITGDITIQFLLTSEDLVGTSYMLAFAAGGDAESANALYACRGAASSENYSWFSESGAGVDASYGGWNGSGNHTIHHLTYVRESDIVTLYIDGAKRGSSGTLATPTGGTSSYLDVGAFDGSSIWRGTMACVKIVNSALTSTQVYDEYKTTWADAPSSSSGGGGSSIDESQVALLSQVFGS
jgi:hypothetical protein